MDMVAREEAANQAMVALLLDEENQKEADRIRTARKARKHGRQDSMHIHVSAIL